MTIFTAFFALVQIDTACWDVFRSGARSGRLLLPQWQASFVWADVVCSLHACCIISGNVMYSLHRFLIVFECSEPWASEPWAYLLLPPTREKTCRNIVCKVFQQAHLKYEWETLCGRQWCCALSSPVASRVVYTWWVLWGMLTRTHPTRWRYAQIQYSLPYPNVHDRGRKRIKAHLQQWIIYFGSSN